MDKAAFETAKTELREPEDRMDRGRQRIRLRPGRERGTQGAQRQGQGRRADHRARSDSLICAATCQNGDVACCRWRPTASPLRIVPGICSSTRRHAKYVSSKMRSQVGEVWILATPFRWVPRGFHGRGKEARPPSGPSLSLATRPQLGRAVPRPGFCAAAPGALPTPCPAPSPPGNPTGRR